MAGPPARFTDDTATANESIQKLATLDFETLVFGHGEPIKTGASEAVARRSQPSFY